MTPDTPTPKNPDIPPPLESKEAAMAWAEQIVAACEDARAACDVAAASALGIDDQRRKYTAYLVHHGNALGVVGTLLRVGLISPIAYNAFVHRVRASLRPTVSGVVP